jgi:hypothetical protein
MTEALKEPRTVESPPITDYEAIEGVSQEKARKAWKKLEGFNLDDSRIIGRRFEFTCTENNVLEIRNDHFEVVVLIPTPKPEVWPNADRLINSFILKKKNDGTFVVVQDVTLRTDKDGHKLFGPILPEDVDLMLDDINRGVIDTPDEPEENDVDDTIEKIREKFQKNS